MNAEIEKKAKRVFGGSYRPVRGDYRWKHKVTDQLNKMLCLVAELPGEPYGSDLRDLVERVANFEEIPYHD